MISEVFGEDSDGLEDSLQVEMILMVNLVRPLNRFQLLILLILGFLKGDFLLENDNEVEGRLLLRFKSQISVAELLERLKLLFGYIPQVLLLDFPQLAQDLLHSGEFGYHLVVEKERDISERLREEEKQELEVDQVLPLLVFSEAEQILFVENKLDFSEGNLSGKIEFVLQQKLLQEVLFQVSFEIQKCNQSQKQLHSGGLPSQLLETALSAEGLNYEGREELLFLLSDLEGIHLDSLQESV